MLKYKLTHSKDPGFTIVELLIVIVTIAVLAAISMITYANISARAKEAKLASTMSNLERKVDSKRITDGKASLTIAPTSVDEILNYYEINAMRDSLIIQTFDTHGDCVDSQSDTCDWDDPVFERDDVVFVGIYPSDSAPADPWSSCKSYGGVTISYTSPLDEEEWIEVTIPDDDLEGDGYVGYICSAVT